MFNEIIIFIQGGIYIQRNNYFDSTNYMYMFNVSEIFFKVFKIQNPR